MFALFFTPQWNSNHPWQARNLLGRRPLNTHTHTKTVSPVSLLLLGITNVLAELSLYPVFLSCLARICVFHITEERSACFHVTKFPFLLPGSGAGDLLSDRVWIVLLVLQANVAGPIHTGRYTYTVAWESIVTPLLFTQFTVFLTYFLQLIMRKMY